MTRKPPYRVLTMHEMNNTPRRPLKVASFFSGGGGSSTGYKMDGFEVLYANEFVPAAQATYRANHPGAHVDPRDIRSVKPEEVLEILRMQPGELDLLDGSPPCSSFSMSGSREKGWGEKKAYSDGKVQRTDDLFLEFIRMLKVIRPKTFVAENVAGLVKGTAKGTFFHFLDLFRSCGYRVKVEVLKAMWLGVPQDRERVIFVGVREDLPFDPVHPPVLPYFYTFEDALGGLTELPGESRPLTAGTKMRALYDWTVKHQKIQFADASRALYKKDSSFNHTRCAWNRPAPTIVQGSQSAYHPTLARTLTIPELKRVCSFPDDYILTGTFQQQWERCGRAVPPVMMMHVARAIRTQILERL